MPDNWWTEALNRWTAVILAFGAGMLVGGLLVGAFLSWWNY